MISVFERTDKSMQTISSFGGINFSSEIVDFQIKRDGNGAPLPAEFQPFRNMQIKGFAPVIIKIAPMNVPAAQSLPFAYLDEEGPSLMGIVQEEENNSEHQQISYHRQDVFVEIRKKYLE